MNVNRVYSDTICFIDTNIWLYAFIQGQDAGKNRLARKVIKECEVVVSTQIINEMCVNLTKKEMLPENEIRDLILSIYRKYRVYDLSLSILVKASKIRENYSFSFWDSIVAASALDCEAKYLLSEDMQNDFVLENCLQIINPFK